MTITDQIQIYRLSEDLDDLILNVVLAATDQDVVDEHDLALIDGFYQDAYDVAVEINNKGIQGQVAWLMENNWTEKEIIEELLKVEEGDTDESYDARENEAFV